MMKKSQLIFPFVLALSGVLLNLSGCNLANSADYGGDGLAAPKANLNIVDASTGNLYSEQQEITLETSGEGSRNSSVASCITTLYQKDDTGLFDTKGQAMGEVTQCGRTNMVMPSVGQYILDLVVTDDLGATASTQRTITVVEPIFDALFTAQQYASTSTDANGVTYDDSVMGIRLDATASLTGRSDAQLAYNWTVRLKLDNNTELTVDSFVSQEPITTLQVDTAGIYVVQLTLTDNYGNRDVVQDSVSIYSAFAEEFAPDFNMYTTLVDTTATPPTYALGQINGIETSLFAPNTLQVDVLPNNSQADYAYCRLLSATQQEVTQPDYIQFDANAVSKICYLPVIVGGTYIVEVTVIATDGTEHALQKTVRFIDEVLEDAN